MKLEIISPSGTVLSRETDRVTVPGGAGSFTILRGHAPILSTLVPGKVAYSGGEEAVGGGVLHAENDTIKIYTDHA